MTASVRRAGPADVPTVIALLVDALSWDPVAEWLVPDAGNRADVLHRLLAIDVDHAIETGHVDVAGDWSAVAAWRRHDLDADRWALGDYHLTTFAGRTAPRFGELNAAVRSYRSDAPHHWLSWLAVQHGYGSPAADKLLHQHHHRLAGEWADLVGGRGWPTVGWERSVAGGGTADQVTCLIAPHPGGSQQVVGDGT